MYSRMCVDSLVRVSRRVNLNLLRRHRGLTVPHRRIHHDRGTCADESLQEPQARGSCNLQKQSTVLDLHTSHSRNGIERGATIHLNSCQLTSRDSLNAEPYDYLHPLTLNTGPTSNANHIPRPLQTLHAAEPRLLDRRI